MKLQKLRPTPAFWVALIVALGGLAAIAGVCREFGLGCALIVGGILTVVFALTMVDVD